MDAQELTVYMLAMILYSRVCVRVSSRARHLDGAGVTSASLNHHRVLSVHSLEGYCWFLFDISVVRLLFGALKEEEPLVKTVLYRRCFGKLVANLITRRAGRRSLRLPA